MSVIPSERRLSPADVGFQCIDHISIPCSCPTFRLFVPPSLSRNFGTSFLFCCRVLCYTSQLHSLHRSTPASVATASAVARHAFVLCETWASFVCCVLLLEVLKLNSKSNFDDDVDGVFSSMGAETDESLKFTRYTLLALCPILLYIHSPRNVHT